MRKLTKLGVVVVDAAKLALKDGKIHTVGGLPTDGLGKGEDGKPTKNQALINKFASALRSAMGNLDSSKTITWRGPEDGVYFYQVSDIKPRNRNGSDAS